MISSGSCQTGNGKGQPRIHPEEISDSYSVMAQCQQIRILIEINKYLFLSFFFVCMYVFCVCYEDDDEATLSLLL